MYIFVIMFFFTCPLYAQTSFSLKKEGNSIITLKKPKDYLIIEDTISSMLYIGEKNKYIDYYFRRTRMYNSQCSIFLYSSLSPVFDSLMDIKNETKQNIIIYNSFKNKFKPSLWFKGEIISYKISPMHQHPDGYHYVDIFKTTYREGYKKYVTNMKRVFLIDGIEHRISVYTKGYPYNKTIRSSRKAVCCVFEELVNNLVVELE